MGQNNSQFNRNLFIILAVLFVLSLAAFSFLNFRAGGWSPEWWMLLLNVLILSIPFILVYGSIYVLVSAWREHASGGKVSQRTAKIIHWAPRLAAILIIFFISLFSLDVFEEGTAPLEVLGGFIIHNIPSFVMITLLVIAWKRPAVGFWAFLIAGVLFILFFVRSIFAVSNLLIFVLPILLIAGLFYADWKWLKPLSPEEFQAGT